MKQYIEPEKNKKTSHFKRGEATVIGMPITYDEKTKVYKFHENSHVSGLKPSKHERHTCDKVSIGNQSHSLGSDTLAAPTKMETT